MKKNRKPFAETKVGKLLKNVGSPILEMVGNVIPGADIISNVIDMVMGDKTLPEHKKAEILRELEIELKVAEIEANDRANARNREIEVLKSGGNNYFQYLVGLFILIGYGAIIYVVLFEDVKDKELFYFIAGNVFAFGASVVSYYFGTSKSSADKNKLIR